MSMETEKILECFPSLAELAIIPRVSGQKHAYTAVSPEFGDVVVKVACPFNDDPRLIREIEIMQDGDFRQVPKFRGYKIVDSPLGRMLLTVEDRIKGADLFSILAKTGQPDYTTLINLTRDILTTLCDVEKKGIVHRDIKPANIIQDESGKFWLIDFGIARVLGAESITATGSPDGPQTLGYASPEQMDNIKAEITSKSDLFSLGVVLTECILGYNPFLKLAQSRYEAKSRVRNLEIKYPDVRGDDRGVFVSFVKWLTEKRPLRRPGSAAFALQIFNANFP